MNFMKQGITLQEIFINFILLVNDSDAESSKSQYVGTGAILYELNAFHPLNANALWVVID